MHRSLMCLLSVGALLLPAASARADQFELFTLDPTRSYIEFRSGDIGATLPNTQFFYSALAAQAGMVPSPLSGEFVLQIGNDAANPTFFATVPGTIDLRPGDVNAAAPGVGGTAGTTAAAIGLSFFDAALGVGGTAALHDLVFAAAGFFSPSANALGPYGLWGDLNWASANGAIEIATDLGIGGTALVPFAGAAGYVDRFQSQFSEIVPGVYEVVMPYEFTLGFGPLPGPIPDLGISATLGGVIVATTVPEPAAGALLFLAGWIGRRAVLRRERTR